MNRGKIIYIVSDIDKALAFEWVTQLLINDCQLQFILIGPMASQLAKFLKSTGVVCHIVSDQAFPGTISKFARVFRILKRERPHVVHTHLWRANLIGLSVAWILRVPQRIYTRHHAKIHYDQYPSGRKWDLLCNFLATNIVAISKNIEHILVHWDRADVKKIAVIHHGFDFSYFDNVPEERVNALRQKYSIGERAPVIGCIARYLEWKGIQYTIQAFQKFQQIYPGAVLVLANAKGDYANEIKVRLNALPRDSYREILFEDDLAALYKLFSVFVHVPIDERSEAFGQTYVEALVSGIPSVFTQSGVAPEFIVHEENALVVPFCNSGSIFDAMKRITQEPHLREKLIKKGKESVQQFRVSNMIDKLRNIYEA